MSYNHINQRPPPTTVNKIAAATAETNLGVKHTQITVCAQGGDLTMRFGPEGLTAADGDDWPLAEGEKETFYIGGESCNRVSIAGTGALLWYPG